MALVRCADCSREVSDAALACPHCGRPPSHGRAKENNRLRRAGAGAILVGTVIINSASMTATAVHVFGAIVLAAGLIALIAGMVRR